MVGGASNGFRVGAIPDVMVSADANQWNLGIDQRKILLVLGDLSFVAGLVGGGIGEVPANDHELWLKTIDMFHRLLNELFFSVQPLVAGEHAVLRIGKLHEKVGLAPRPFGLRIKRQKGA